MLILSNVHVRQLQRKKSLIFKGAGAGAGSSAGAGFGAGHLDPSKPIEPL